MRPHIARRLPFVEEFVRRRRVSLYDRRVGARRIHKRDVAAGRNRNKEGLTFWSITAAIVLPTILAVALVATDMRADLSDLRSTGKVDSDGAVPLGWPELNERRQDSARVRMIGYMMDEDPGWRDGTSVHTFILLPEAGRLLHPAHRIPGQSVAVWSTKPVVFRNRQLVWASGALNRTIRRSRDDQPDWAMISADVRPATENDIRKWFRP